MGITKRMLSPSTRQLGDVGQLQQHFLAGRQVADAGLEHIRPFFVEQKRSIPALHRIVVAAEGLLALFHFADDQPTVDHRLEPADRRPLVQWEYIDRFDRLDSRLTNR